MHNKHIVTISREKNYETCLFRTQHRTLGDNCDV